MDTLTFFTREWRARVACSATLALAALLSACGGGSAADPAAAPAALVASSPGSAPAQPAGAAGMPALAAAPPCARSACAAAPIDALAALPMWAGAPEESDAPGYLIASTDLITTAGEPPYPDLRTLPTRVVPFQAATFGDMSVFSVASVR